MLKRLPASPLRSGRPGMITPYDIAYGLGLGLASPVWLTNRRSREKVMRALHERMGREQSRDLTKPAIWIHAVSLGEMNATRAMIRLLQVKRQAMQYVISTTTITGYDRGRELYGEDPTITLVRFPLDFSWAVARSLDALQPAAVVLMELEVWPNFVRACADRSIPVLLANGRITSKSYRNYRLAGPLVSGMFKRLSGVCAQDETYARRFIALGADASKVRVTGTMKFDTAQPTSRVAGVEQIAASIGLRPESELIFVAGSTGPGEEEIVLAAYRELLKKWSRLRLVIVPRHPQRFDEAAKAITDAKFDVIRRSKPPGIFFHNAIPPVVLGDTMGELRTFFAMANVVFVGRSLVDLGPRQHGSDMIEPAALAKPVIVGPFTGNFTEAVQKFREASAIKEVFDRAGLIAAIDGLLSDRIAADDMGERALAVVKREQGATARHVQAILDLVPA